jgi:hypothetical protein
MAWGGSTLAVLGADEGVKAGHPRRRLAAAQAAARRLRQQQHVAVGSTTDGRVEVVAVFDLESAAPGDPVEDFLWPADHGVESRIFRSFVAGYLEQGRLTPTRPSGWPSTSSSAAPLDVLGWARDADPEWFVQAQWLIEQVLDGVRLRLA